MKKIFAIALALTLVLSMGTTAFAVDYVGEAGLDAVDSSTSFEINGKIAKTTENISVIGVDVSYGAMRFVFLAEEGYMWDPATHTYKEVTDEDGSEEKVGKGWQAENKSNFVTVTNHSNVKVDVTLNASTNLTFEPDGDSGEDAGKVLVEFTNTADSSTSMKTINTTIDAAAPSSALNSQQAEFTLMPTGYSDGGKLFNEVETNITNTEFKTIGTVTVSIKEADQVIPTT